MAATTVARQGPLPTWVLVWFYVTAIVCTWDASFIMLRPYSMPGGVLAWVWYLYKYYITLDQRYSDTDDDYVFAQSLLNYVEVIINVIAIAMHYMKHRQTCNVAFIVSVMTWWKTVLYFLMLSEFCTGGRYRQGNSAITEFLLVVVPNGVWIVIPALVMYALWPTYSPDEKRRFRQEANEYFQTNDKMTLAMKGGDMSSIAGGCAASFNSGLSGMSTSEHSSGYNSAVKRSR